MRHTRRILLGAVLAAFANMLTHSAGMAPAAEPQPDLKTLSSGATSPPAASRLVLSAPTDIPAHLPGGRDDAWAWRPGFITGTTGAW